MDGIKTECKSDPLDLQSSYCTQDDDPLCQERKSLILSICEINRECNETGMVLLSDVKIEENPTPFTVKNEIVETEFVDLSICKIKRECLDSTTDPISGNKIEQTPKPIILSSVKSEAVEESLDGVVVKKEVHLEETTENEIPIEGTTVFQNNGMSSQEAWNSCCDPFQTDNAISLPSQDSIAHGVTACIGSMENEVLNQSSDKNITLGTENKTFGNSSSPEPVSFHRFKCDTCFKYFSHTGILKTHLRDHSDGNTFKCNECGKNSLSLNQLEEHSDEKLFKCHECCKTFYSSRRLKYHLRKHSGERPFKCNVCGKLFCWPSNLNAHSRIHSGLKPFMCDICRKCFSRLGHLKVHARTHTGERPFKCHVCGKSFSYSGVLTDHIRSHTGEKPYKCDDCGKCFGRIGYLKKHVLLHKT